MTIGILTLRLFLPGCTSLKEKRGLLKPLLARLHREYNVAAAEIDYQDRWQEAVIGVTTLSNEAAQVRRVLQATLEFAQSHFSEIEIADHRIELV
jgi:uncharacterized protein YlxP (DUF503 family)